MDHSGSLARRNTLLDPEEPIGVISRHRNLTSTAPSESYTRGEYAQRRTQWKLNAETIINKLKTNQTFEAGTDYHMSGLPVLVDLARYGISEEKQIELFTLEIRRLVNIVNDGKPATLEGAAEWFGNADRDGYTLLDKLGQQIEAAIQICAHDLELQMLEHFPLLSLPEHFKTSRNYLLSRFAKDSSRDPTEAWKDIEIGHFNDKALHAIVNFLTASMTQVLLRVMHGEFWDDNCIITVAKCAAKIKVLSMDFVSAVDICLSGKGEWMRRMNNIMDKEPNPPTVESGDQGKVYTPAGKQMDAMARTVVHRGTKYFGIMHTFSSGILVLLNSSVTNSICSDPGAALPPSVFESCSIVYDTGFRGRRNILCQERNGSVGVTGNRHEVHCSSFAFEVCLESLEQLSKRLESSYRPRTSGDSKPECRTMVYWKWTELRSELDDLKSEEEIFKGGARTGQFETRSMCDAITALVPFSFVSGRFTGQLAGMIQKISFVAGRGDPLSMCIETRFLASFMMQTSEHKAYKTRSARADPSVTSVSCCPIAETRALAQGPMSSALSNGNDAPTDDRLRENLLKSNKKIRAGLDLVDEWTLDSSSIIIQSRWYCWGTLCFCGILVLGGLAIGFTVNQRIRGVDPFNISVFCWVLAGFIVVFVKSLRVENWPWRDFFAGRVVCRSITEVTAVTGIDPQLLLTILLRLEPTVNMSKRGPFCGVFLRRDPEKEGLSVDVPAKTTTLINAGCFFIKVQGTHGPEMVAIRAMTTSPYRIVRPQGAAAVNDDVKCRDLTELGKWGNGEEQMSVFLLSVNPTRWSKVAGIFWEEAYFS